jgi:hypothetical protein
MALLIAMRRSFVVGPAIYGHWRGCVRIEIAAPRAAFGAVFWRLGLLLIPTAAAGAYAVRLARATLWLAVIIFDMSGRLAMQTLVTVIILAQGRVIPPMGVSIILLRRRLAGTRAFRPSCLGVGARRRIGLLRRADRRFVAGRRCSAERGSPRPFTCDSHFSLRHVASDNASGRQELPHEK